ncbi:hypothetical protein GCM10012275_64720 [Longimycelium tulufanense]|uniref:Uncharacterized protein n=1 Tax=Longimycelium tulufanense TaxID=907463 RepID=A0A8J3CKT3_9PSEU|nr:hypothetical protein [Longimycelium tulufanense]GGM84999.1 hypothetical protein GCM10012275_64720 [Longimycelium tulufanense]
MHTNRLYGQIARREHPTKSPKTAAKAAKSAERDQVRREVTAELARLGVITVTGA